MLSHVERSGRGFYNKRTSQYYRDDVDAAECDASKPGAPPSVADVLSCLLSDANAIHMTFEEWCSDFGYDSDSRKAEKTYLACVAMGRDVYRVLADADLQELAEAEH